MGIGFGELSPNPIRMILSNLWIISIISENWGIIPTTIQLHFPRIILKSSEYPKNGVPFRFSGKFDGQFTKLLLGLSQ